MDYRRLETVFFPSFFRLYARRDQKALTMFGESVVGRVPALLMAG
jgi:hypothetical protein